MSKRASYRLLVEEAEGGVAKNSPPFASSGERHSAKVLRKRSKGNSKPRRAWQRIGNANPRSN